MAHHCRPRRRFGYAEERLLELLQDANAMRPYRAAIAAAQELRLTVAIEAPRGLPQEQHTSCAAHYQPRRGRWRYVFTATPRAVGGRVSPHASRDVAYAN
jgi:hypothetical protein